MVALVGDDVDVLDVICEFGGRPAHDIVAAWVDAELARAGSTAEIARLARRRRRGHRHSTQ